MRFNRDTERGIDIDAIAAQCRAAIADLCDTVPARSDKVWDCTNGRGWIDSFANDSRRSSAAFARNNNNN